MKTVAMLAREKTQTKTKKNHRISSVLAAKCKTQVAQQNFDIIVKTYAYYNYKNRQTKDSNIMHQSMLSLRGGGGGAFDFYKKKLFKSATFGHKHVIKSQKMYPVLTKVWQHTNL